VASSPSPLSANLLPHASQRHPGRCSMNTTDPSPRPRPSSRPASGRPSSLPSTKSSTKAGSKSRDCRPAQTATLAISMRTQRPGSPKRCPYLRDRLLELTHGLARKHAQRHGREVGAPDLEPDRRQAVRQVHAVSPAAPRRAHFCTQPRGYLCPPLRECAAAPSWSPLAPPLPLHSPFLMSVEYSVFRFADNRESSSGARLHGGGVPHSRGGGGRGRHELVSCGGWWERSDSID
jgi:hypothetical protein